MTGRERGAAAAAGMLAFSGTMQTDTGTSASTAGGAGAGGNSGSSGGSTDTDTSSSSGGLTSGSGSAEAVSGASCRLGADRPRRYERRPVRVSPLLAEALTMALRSAEATDGAVGPTVGSAMDAIGYDRDFTLVREDDRPSRRGNDHRPGGRSSQAGRHGGRGAPAGHHIVAPRNRPAPSAPRGAQRHVITTPVGQAPRPARMPPHGLSGTVPPRTALKPPGKLQQQLRVLRPPHPQGPHPGLHGPEQGPAAQPLLVHVQRLGEAFHPSAGGRRSRR